MTVNDKRLLVANTASDSISVIDAVNNELVDTIFLDEIINNSRNIFLNRQVPLLGTHCMAVNKERGFLYLVNSFDGSIFQIDIDNMQILNTVYVGRFPTHLELLDGMMLIINSDSDSISIIDEESFTLIENICIGIKPHDVKVNKIDKKIYVTNSNGYSISLIDLEKYNLDFIKLDNHPLHIYIYGNMMFILCSQTNGMKCSNITIFDLVKHQIIKKIPIENIIMDMAVLIDKKMIFITNLSNGYIYKIHIENDNITKYYIGGMPSNILWDGDNIIYVTDIQRNLLLVFDIEKESVINTIEVGLEPSAMILLK